MGHRRKGHDPNMAPPIDDLPPDPKYPRGAIILKALALGPMVHVHPYEAYGVPELVPPTTGEIVHLPTHSREEGR